MLVAAVLLKAAGNLASAGMALLLMDTVMAAYTLRAAGQLSGSFAVNTLRSALNPTPLLRLLATKRHAY